MFEEALALGMEGPAVHYNIGVAAYRTEDLARAERAFREVARTPAMAALAHYNLGLIALKRGDERAARREFDYAARESGDEQLAALATQRLAELPASPQPPTWSLYARAGAGYDDNVALRSESIDSTATGQDDSFAELLVAASGTFGQSWFVDAGAGVLEYGSLDAFDQRAFSAGVRRGLPIDAWYLEPGAYAAQLSLGGDVFERSAGAGARVTRSFTKGQWLQAQLRVTAVDGEGDFSGLSGARAELGLQYDWSWQAWSFGANTRAELNDAEEDIFASRWVELGATTQWGMSPRLTLAAAATLRRTRHPGDESTDGDWQDRRMTLRVGAIVVLWKDVQVFVRYEHERNASPIEANDYDRNWIAASIEYSR